MRGVAAADDVEDQATKHEELAACGGRCLGFGEMGENSD